MRKILLGIAVVVFLIIPEKALSQYTKDWKGIEWECPMTNGIEVDEQYDNLLLKQPHPDYTSPFAAYYCTYGFDDFRSSSTPWVEVSFEDEYPDAKSSIKLLIRDECPPAVSKFFTQIGADAENADEDDNYFIQWCNPSTDKCVKVITEKERSGGAHTIKVGMKENGTVEYWIDNEFLWSTDDIPIDYGYEAPEYFGNIILMAQFSSATFTDYQVGTNYSPSPSSSAVDIDSALDIDIDIRPFSHSNKIHHRKWGLIPVAILSRNGFDALKEVDEAKLTFGRTGNERSKVFFLRRGKDVNHDGLRDLICFFRASLAGFQVGDTVGILKGSTRKGQAIEGHDSVNILAKKKRPFEHWHKH